MPKNPIFIPLSGYKYLGGVESFMRNLERYLAQTGYSYLRKPDKARVVFFPVTFDQPTLARLKARGGRVVQRVAGGYYESQHGEKFAEMNRPIADVYHNFADLVVFQSEYGKRQNFKIFGAKPDEQYKVIINGVDKSIFSPAIQKPDREVIKFVSTGSFRKEVMLKPAISALDSLAGEYNFEYWIIGEVTNPELMKYIDRPYVRYMAKMPLSNLAEKLRKSDAFIHTQINDICPNSVLEAISTGIPVIGFASGSLPELLFFGHDLLAEMPEELIQKVADANHHKLANKLRLFLENVEKYSAVANANSHLYPFTECGSSYVQVFEEQIELAGKPLGTGRDLFKRFFRSN